MANNPNAAGKRSQEESLRTQSRILDKAEYLFARLGFGGVSLREIAKATGVHHHTIQHHYGSKEGLYQTVLCRWDHRVQELLLAAISEENHLENAIKVVVDQLFDFMLEKRDWVALTARAATGAGQPGGPPGRMRLKQDSWVQFMDDTLRDHKLGGLDLDLGLLMITVEGMLNNHILAQKHYQDLYGKDLDDPELRTRTKEHIKKVLSALVFPKTESSGKV
jgi:AcrR family transcriptional regulator